jgi:hypothetical protein
VLGAEAHCPGERVGARQQASRRLNQDRIGVDNGQARLVARGGLG